MKYQWLEPWGPNDMLAIQELLFQLTRSRKKANACSYERLKSVFLKHQAYIAVFRERTSRKIIGMGMLLVEDLLLGRVARIEDVVIHRAHRGRGLGRALVKALIAKAREQKAMHIDLTSRPERIDANALYQSLGFKQRYTNVYRRTLRS